MQSWMFGRPSTFGNLQLGECFAFADGDPPETFLAIRTEFGAAVLCPNHPLGADGPKELPDARLTSKTRYALPNAQIVANSDLDHMHPGPMAISSLPGILIHAEGSPPLLVIEATGAGDTHNINLVSGQRVRLATTIFIRFTAWQIVQRGPDDKIVVLDEFSMS